MHDFLNLTNIYLTNIEEWILSEPLRDGSVQSIPLDLFAVQFCGHRPCTVKLLGIGCRYMQCRSHCRMTLATAWPSMKNRKLHCSNFKLSWGSVLLNIVRSFTFVSLRLVVCSTLTFSPPVAVDSLDHQNQHQNFKLFHFLSPYTRSQNLSSSTMHAYVGFI